MTTTDQESANLGTTYRGHVASEIKPGAYDRLITAELAGRLSGLPAERVLREVLENEDAPDVLARHLRFLFRRLIQSVNRQEDTTERIRLSNRIVRSLMDVSADVVTTDDLIDESDYPVLWGVLPETSIPTYEMKSPSVRLSESALLINGRNQPNIGHEINRELTSADNVDLLCSFVMNSGLNVIINNLRGVVERGGQARVLTTTYMGATQRRALDRLVELGAQVRVSYDATTTRLHAKSWLLKRDTGATTAYVGSSNLSKSALTDGIEWNIRLSSMEQGHIIDSISATFEDYWNDAEFEPYDPERDGIRLDAALKQAGTDPFSPIAISFVDLDVTPRPYQKEVLDQLEFQREVNNRSRNLVAMATGTGKTVVAGLDFRRLFQAGQVKTVLFVAHRKEILLQSMSTFRTIMRDGSFGELFVDGIRPTDWAHVFGSIQSLANLNQERLSPASFDMIIVDEFHHAAADSYTKLLTYFEPKFLLGLTATPERSDGRSILHWFDHSISAELRIWEAIDRQILCPFQYYGIHDNTDLAASGIRWSRSSGYDVEELTNLYTGNDARVSLILQQLDNHVTDFDQLKCLGFCVSVRHAEYMARKFSAAGIPSVSVTSKLDSVAREAALRDLKSGAIKVIFAVDIFNEGVDIPDVNTILMLRPTDSATIFLQQLGRGLRKSQSKNHLLVLDFVGNQNREFRFDKRYGSLLGVGRRGLEREIEDGFPHLPSGCHFDLDRVSKEIILGNIKQALRINKTYLRSELRNIGPVSTHDFFSMSDIELRDFYRQGRSLTEMKQELFGGDPLQDLDREIAKALGRILHVDDDERIMHYIRILESSATDVGDPFVMMLAHSLFSTSVDQHSAASRLSQVRGRLIYQEVIDVLSLLRQNRRRVVSRDPENHVPLSIHATYSRAEIVAAFGLSFTGADVAGVRFAKAHGADLAFVTLNKTSQHFSPSTMYADTALSPMLFQWESQSSTSVTSPTGQRYINHRSLGTSFHLFVRDWKIDPESQTTMPYLYLGPADYVSHVGDRPMRIQWRLRHEMPADVFVRSKVVAS